MSYNNHEAVPSDIDGGRCICGEAIDAASHLRYVPGVGTEYIPPEAQGSHERPTESREIVRMRVTGPIRHNIAAVARGMREAVEDTMADAAEEHMRRMFAERFGMYLGERISYGGRASVAALSDAAMEVVAEFFRDAGV